MTRSRLGGLVLLLAALGCGGASGGTTSSSSPRSGQADITQMRALLDRYSPTGSWIVRTNDTLPRAFTFDKRSITLTNSGDFGSYFDDGAPEHLVPYMSTAVHEVYHAVTFRLGYQLQAEAGQRDPVDSEGFYSGGTPLLVRYNATYPAREMATSYPLDARATRFATYISPSQDDQSTQQEGIFGLLDEWTAYLHSARTVLDFWPWIRDEAPRTRDLYVRYRSRFHELWVPHAELKLFILHYLLHARDHRPDVYRAVVANDSFRRAFVSADDAWTVVLAKAAALEPEIAAIAGERGAGTTTFHRDAAYPALQSYLASEPYRRMLAELRGTR